MSGIARGWFGSALSWSRNADGLWSTTYRGHDHAVVKLTTARAVQALTPPGWYFTARPGPEIDYPGSYGPLLGHVRTRALMMAEAILITDPVDQRHGKHVPNLISCLHAGATFRTADDRTVWCQPLWHDGRLVLIDLSDRFSGRRGSPEIADIRPVLRPAHGGLGGLEVDWIVRLPGEDVAGRQRLYLSFHAAVAGACWHTSAARAEVSR